MTFRPRSHIISIGGQSISFLGVCRAGENKLNGCEHRVCTTTTTTTILCLQARETFLKDAQDEPFAFGPWSIEPIME